MKKTNQQSGFTMIEVLVAAIILMVSLLGMGALQSTAMKRNTSAMNKTQAMEAMTYIADAMRSQSSWKPSNQGVNAVYDGFGADFWGENNYQSNLITDCGSGCTRNAMANSMLAQWEAMIGQLPKGKGFIQSQLVELEVDGNDVPTTVYNVTIMWDDRQLAQNYDGSSVELDTDCSGNVNVSLACMRMTILP